MEPVIVLCSGGLKSAVAAAVTAQDQPIALLHARCGHLASAREAEAFDALCKRMQPKHSLAIDLPHLAVVTSGPRFTSKGGIEGFDGTPDAFARLHIRGLLTTLVGAASSWAATLRSKRVVIGITEDSTAAAGAAPLRWPDHSRDFVHVVNHLLGIAAIDAGMELEAPLLELSHAEIIRLGRSLGVPMEQSWSCMSGGRSPCATCAKCLMRARAFRAAGQLETAVAATA